MKIDASYKVIIGIPTDYIALDSKTLMEKEEQHFDGFIETRK